MRLLALIILFASMIAGLASAAEEDKTPEEKIRDERSFYAVDIFRQSCLMNFSDLSLRHEYLDANYKKLEGEKRQKFLDFVHVIEGEAWSAVISPKISFTVISAGNGDCHLIANNVSAEKLHKEMKNLALDVRDTVPFGIVDYKGVKQDETIKNSRFDLKAPDGSILMTATTVTKETALKEKDETHYADGVISALQPEK